MNETIVRDTLIANTPQFDDGRWYIDNLNVTKERQTFTLDLGSVIFEYSFLNTVFRQLHPTLPLPSHYRDTDNPSATKIIISRNRLKKLFDVLGWVIADGTIASSCMRCRTEFSGDFVSVSFNRFWCTDCLELNYTICDACGELKNRRSDRMVTTENDDTYCGNCIDNNDSLCFCCDNCDSWYSGDDTYGTDSGTYCQSCYNENYTVCDACDSDINTDDTRFCEDNELDYCDECWNSHSCNLLHALSRIFTPTGVIAHNTVYNLPSPIVDNFSSPGNAGWMSPRSLKFHKGKRTKFLGSNRFVGVEIEVERGTFNTKMKTEFPKDSTIKMDGSVQGFELNTPPASGDALEKIVKKSCEVLRKYGYQGTEKCGVHIHIDSRDIKNKPTKIANLAKTYLAIEDMIFSILPPSRWDNHYCRGITHDFLIQNVINKPIKNEDLTKKWYNRDKRITMQEIETGKGRHDRYHGLNISAMFSNRGTLELRYHSGTTSASKILNWIALNLRLFNYAIRDYKEEEMKALFDMETGQEKFELFCKVFKLSPELKEYMRLRASLFNPEWAIQFNKGRIERDMEENLSVHYIKILKKEIETIGEDEYIRLKDKFKIDCGKGWTKKFNRTEIRRQAQQLAENKVAFHLLKKYGTTNQNKSFGLIAKQELQEKINLLRKGMLMSVNKETGIEQDDEFENETGGLII